VSHKRYYRVFSALLIVSVLLLSQAQSGFAQPYAPEDDPSTGADAASAEPAVVKEAEGTADVEQEPKILMYLPIVETGTGQAEAADTTAVWQTITYQTFEGVWPSGSWRTFDYDGAHGGTQVWNDVSSRPYTGYWSAHPTNGAPYPNYVHSIMEYGPFSLASASSARFSFYYYIDTEARYDFFNWQYSCDGGLTWNGGEFRSGLFGWRSVSRTLPCAGYSQVYMRWVFRSDYSVTDQGVWVDNIRIQKYQ
jgi:hypothetical protein